MTLRIHQNIERGKIKMYLSIKNFNLSKLLIIMITVPQPIGIKNIGSIRAILIPKLAQCFFLFAASIHVVEYLNQDSGLLL
jgi:Na+/alanine symporter